MLELKPEEKEVLEDYVSNIAMVASGLDDIFLDFWDSMMYESPAYNDTHYALILKNLRPKAHAILKIIRSIYDDFENLGLYGEE